MKLSSLLDIEVEELLPAEHAAYRPLVRDALMFFLQRLPPFRMAELAAAQARLPSNPSTAKRLVALFKQCPTLHKLGQVLARDERLTATLRMQLQQLESFPPTVEVAALRAAIDRAVGDTPGISIADQALAEASVAVVVPFSWRANRSAEPVRGVMKVLKPDIRARLDHELDVWSELGAYVEQRSEHYGLPDLDYRGIVDGVSKRLRQEVVLAHEQAHLKEAARLYANAPDIHVPELFPFCTDDVTAMTRIDGVKLTDVPLAQRAHAARLLSDALIARPLLSSNVRAPFHADPHPGNLLLTDTGELGILDWSLVVRLNENERRAFKILLRSALGLDEAGLVRGLQGICTQPPSIGELRRVVRGSVRQLRWGTPPGLRWIKETIDRAVMEARIRVSDDLVLFRKALHTLNGVASELSSVSAIDAALVTRAIRRYVDDTADAMVNPAAAPLSVAAGINAALFGLWVDAPAAASRYWLGVWQDLLADQRA